MVTIDYVVPPLTGNVFDDLITNLIPRVWYASPSNAIFILYKDFIVLEEVFPGSLSNKFFIFSPRQRKRKGSNPIDKFKGYLHGNTSKSDSGMFS